MEESGPKDLGGKLRWHLYFDGVVNKRGMGIGVVLATPQGQLITFARKLTFDCTNNVTEYEACILALHVVLENEVHRLQVHEDAMLFISHVNGDRKTKDPKLVPYHEHLLKLIDKLEEICFFFMNRARTSTQMPWLLWRPGSLY